MRRAPRVLGLGARLLVLFLGLLLAGRARGDRKEIYTVLGFDAGVNHYNLPESGSGNTTSYAGALDLAVYYGLTNTFHVGGRLRLSSTPNVHFRGARLTMSDGSESVGDVFADHRSVAVGALGLYRVDTGFALAPFFEVETGLAMHQYRRIEQVPAHATYKVDLASASQNSLYGQAAVLLEYRFGNRWMAATGISFRAESGNMQPWAFGVPLRVGFIW